MANIFLFVKYNGHWEENKTYKEKDAIGILVPHTLTYDGLMQTLYDELEMTPTTHRIGVKYETEGVFAPVKICNDRSLKAYLELKKNEPDKTKFILCLDIYDEQMNTLIVEDSLAGAKGGAAVMIDSPGVGSNRNCIVDIGENQPFPIYQNPPILELSHRPSTYDAAPPSEGSRRVSGHSQPPDDGVNHAYSPPNFSTREASEPTEADPSSEGAVNHSAPPSSSSIPISNSRSSEVYDIGSPVRLKRLGLYANKEALQRHLQMYSINNHFKYKTNRSTQILLHVVCCDDNCKWAVRAVRLPKTQIFQIKRSVNEIHVKFSSTKSWRIVHEVM